MRDIGVTGVQTCALPIYPIPLSGHILSQGFYLLSERVSGPRLLVGGHAGVEDSPLGAVIVRALHHLLSLQHLVHFRLRRSEERRVGTECRSRRSPYHYKK